MSDDEYYYDEYDDLHDILYDADPNPDLADDLAEHAAHSPVWQDNPTEELRDYFSDWEYYSDDYFDDDPNLLNGGQSGQRNANPTLHPQRLPIKKGRKRKLSEAREDSDSRQQEVDALAACLQGTVWKRHSPEPTQSFTAGVEKPVALRLSHEIMRAAYSKRQGFGKGRLRRDDSWANDLSLADMGLKTERSMSMHDQSAVDREDVNEEADEAEEVEDKVAEGEHVMDEDPTETDTILEEPYKLKLQAEHDVLNVQHMQDQINSNGNPSKRRRTGPPDLLQAEADERRNMQPSSGRAKKASYPAQKHDEDAQISTALGHDASVLKPTGKKRKLSVSESSATGSTASSRAKRAATTQARSEADPLLTTAAATRPRRNQKK